MYRLGCFRDDIVFFIFLYQRYIYKEDKTRVNEFGYSAEMLDDDNKETQGNVDHEDSLAPLAIEESAEDIQPENLDSGPSGAWKNNQKPKSKKAKKID